MDFGVLEMASATNIDWGPLQMVALLRLPRAEFLATTASWLSLPRPSSVLSSLPQPTGTEPVSTLKGRCSLPRVSPFLSSCLWRKGLGAGRSASWPWASLQASVEPPTLECESPDSSVILDTGGCLSAFSKGKPGWLAKGTWDSPLWLWSALYTFSSGEAGGKQVMRLMEVA